MPSALFTTSDGDIVLRASSQPDTKHDFRVHKFILSLASPVFEDMLAFPQPPDQTSDEHLQLPVVDVPEPPEVLDVILRLIYPGVEPPTITKPSTLSAVLFAADKYDISSIYSTLKESLKAISSRGCDTLWVYIMASRFNFPDLARQAAKAMDTWALSRLVNREDIQHVSSADLHRLVRFVLERHRRGLALIRSIFDPFSLEDSAHCSHAGEDAQDYYFRLQKAVEEAYLVDPCVKAEGLLAVLDMVPDPPRGCKPHSKPADWYLQCDDDDEIFNCPLRPMTIRKTLGDVASDLDRINIRTLNQFFG